LYAETFGAGSLITDAFAGVAIPASAIPSTTGAEMPETRSTAESIADSPLRHCGNFIITSSVGKISTEEVQPGQTNCNARINCYGWL
jgi:hypothetical protein